MTDQVSTCITLNKAFLAFIDDAIAENLSPKTIKYYQYCYKWLGNTIPGETLLCNITHADINKHIRFLLESNKATSVNTHLTGLRVIFNYCNREFDTNIKIKLIKYDRQPKPTYSNHELDLLLRKPDISSCLFSEYRNWVMTNVFVGTGCRLGSCINLRVKDIDFCAGTIYFMKMKTRKALVLPLNSELAIILKEYVKYLGAKPNGFLFPSSKDSEKPLTDTGFSSLYRTYAKRRGVENAGIHKFRHTYAKQFIMNGGNPAKLQRILGHADISTTMVYVALYSVDLKDDVDKFCYLGQSR